MLATVPEAMEISTLILIKNSYRASEEGQNLASTLLKSANVNQRSSNVYACTLCNWVRFKIYSQFTSDEEHTDTK